MRFEQAIDEVEATGPARTSAGRQIACEHRLRPRSKPGRLFVPDMNPLNIAAPDCIGDKVESVARYAPSIVLHRLPATFPPQRRRLVWSFSSPSV
jgi:hypothetical protein